MRRGRREGLTLVEVTVALVLFTVGLLASVSMVTLAARTLGEARRMALAGAAAESLADSLLQGGRPASSGRLERSWGVLRWQPAEEAGAPGTIRIVATGRAPGAGGGPVEPGAGVETILLELFLRVPAGSAAAPPDR